MWLAKNKNGVVVLFKRKPFRDKHQKHATVWNSNPRPRVIENTQLEMYNKDVKNIKGLDWDEKPIEVVLLPNLPEHITVDFLEDNPIYKAIYEAGYKASESDHALQQNGK